MKVGRADRTIVSQAAFIFSLCIKKPATEPEAALRRLKFVYQTVLAQPLLRGSSQRWDCQCKGGQLGVKPAITTSVDTDSVWDPLNRLS